ncbi:MAG: hypothetical protein HKN48_11485, partial [Flavobacteriaceae bacterium]|nr:hypothetical protein [Flavobacteriaceae bacterium]
METYQDSYSQRLLYDNLAGFSYGLELLETPEGWYGIATARFLPPIKLSYGSSPLNPPTSDPISDPEGLMLRSKSPDAIQTSSGDLHVFLAYETNSDDVIRLDYGSSFSNTPTIHNYEGFGFITNGAVRDINSLEIAGDLLLVFPFSNGSVITMNFQDSFDNIVDVSGPD